LSDEKGEYMDNKKFGEFISMLRKEKGWTQADLASKLNVTDKAVSRWERGLGFPDINTIKPLAEALGASVMEIMQSERTPKEEISSAQLEGAIDDVIRLAEYQRKIECRNIAISLFSVTSIVLFVFLWDLMSWEAFIFVCMPCIFLLAGIILIIATVRRRKRKSAYHITLLLGISSFLFPLLAFIVLFFAFAFGAPVPN